MHLFEQNILSDAAKARGAKLGGYLVNHRVLQRQWLIFVLIVT